MSKDPATLWYWNDWHSGTVLMSRFLKGCYMDLLHAQFNNGHLSLEEIKICLGSDFGQAWPSLQKKFKQDDKGLFFNEKAEHEQLKRKAYTESRKNNRKKTYDTTYEKHMIVHMENENENENRNDNIGEGVIGEGELPDLEVGKTVEFCNITLHRKYDRQKVLDLWKAFRLQHDGDFYKSQREKIKHFRNWIKTQPFEKNAKPGTSEDRVNAAANF